MTTRSFFFSSNVLAFGSKVLILASEEGVRAQWVWMEIVILSLCIEFPLPMKEEKRKHFFFWGGGGVLNLYSVYVILHCCEIITLLLWLLPKRPTGRGYVKLLIGGKGLLTGKGVRC